MEISEDGSQPLLTTVLSPSRWLGRRKKKEKKKRRSHRDITPVMNIDIAMKNIERKVAKPTRRGVLILKTHENSGLFIYVVAK